MEQSLKPGNEDGAKEHQTFWCFVFNRHKAAEVYMIFLGLATSSRSLCLVPARGASHTASMLHSVTAGGLERLGPVRLLTCTGGQEEACGAGWRCSSHTHFKELLRGFQPPARSLPPKRGAAKCLGAISSSCPFHPSSVELLALDPGQRLRMEAVPSSNLLDLRQKSY